MWTGQRRRTPNDPGSYRALLSYPALSYRLEAEYLEDTLILHYIDWASEVVQPVKALASKPEDLSSILRTLTVEGEKPLWQLPF